MSRWKCICSQGPYRAVNSGDLATLFCEILTAALAWRLEGI